MKKIAISVLSLAALLVLTIGPSLAQSNGGCCNGQTCCHGQQCCHKK
jgi:hypothetical protein